MEPAKLQGGEGKGEREPEERGKGLRRKLGGEREGNLRKSTTFNKHRTERRTIKPKNNFNSTPIGKFPLYYFFVCHVICLVSCDRCLVN